MARFVAARDICRSPRPQPLNLQRAILNRYGRGHFEIDGPAHEPVWELMDCPYASRGRFTRVAGRLPPGRFNAWMVCTSSQTRSKPRFEPDLVQDESSLRDCKLRDRRCRLSLLGMHWLLPGCWLRCNLVLASRLHHRVHQRLLRVDIALHAFARQVRQRQE